MPLSSCAFLCRPARRRPAPACDPPRRGKAGDGPALAAAHYLTISLSKRRREQSQPSASRLHFEPGLTLPFYAPAGSLALESRLYQTNYRQQGGDAQLGQSINRTLPFFRADGQLNFDRVDRLGDFGYTQTLEPRLQYLYVPYENQDDIALYDTDLLPPGYDGLFRTRRYSGYDRISDANQTTAGITSRKQRPAARSAAAVL